MCAETAGRLPCKRSRTEYRQGENEHYLYQMQIREARKRRKQELSAALEESLRILEIMLQPDDNAPFMRTTYNLTLDDVRNLKALLQNDTLLIQNHHQSSPSDDSEINDDTPGSSLPLISQAGKMVFMHGPQRWLLYVKEQL